MPAAVPAPVLVVPAVVQGLVSAVPVVVPEPVLAVPAAEQGLVLAVPVVVPGPVLVVPAVVPEPGLAAVRELAVVPELRHTLSRRQRDNNEIQIHWLRLRQKHAGRHFR